MEKQDTQTFPPRLIVGNRVWTDQGYQDHGPLEGPRVDVDANQGGTITDVQERSQFVSGYVLYAVRWDNGQVSRHYENELFCIGHLKDRSSFEAAIKPKGPIELTVGPSSGFRSARFELDYDGQPQVADVHDRRLWLECIEPKVKKLKLKVSTTKLKKGE
jgi:hypothetical protein